MATKVDEYTTTEASGSSGAESDVVPMETTVPFGRRSVTPIVAPSAVAFPWFARMIETIAIWPSMGCAGIVDAELGVRSGVPVGGDFGCTSIWTDALPSFPRASSTSTVARFGPTSEYAWLANGDDCSRGWFPSPKSNSYETIRPLPLTCGTLPDASKCTIWPTTGVTSSTESIAVGPLGVAATTARRLNATAHTADASPARCRRDTFAPLRPTRARM